jgi:hypothetical protein
VAERVAAVDAGRVRYLQGLFVGVRMAEYPIVVRELGGKMRLGVEEADALEADLRDVVTEGYQRIDVQDCEDGEQVGVVVASGDSIETVRWSR